MPVVVDLQPLDALDIAAQNLSVAQAVSFPGSDDLLLGGVIEVEEVVVDCDPCRLRACVHGKVGGYADASQGKPHNLQ